MRLVVSLLFSCFFASAACADSIGVFTAVGGEVRILRATNYLAAKPGVEIVRDDIVETAKSASAQLDMEDGSVLKLGPETRLALSDYRLDSNKSVVSAAIDVLSGWMRFAVAKLKPEGRYNINTPVLTIGVRGTEGTIEAENEQGGLHLNEGVVEVTSVGADITPFHPVRVTGGEFIQRVRGQQLAKLPTPPPAFQNRLPPVMHQKLERRAHELKQRGVPPRIIRAITREDAQRLLEKHPQQNEKLRERFKPLGVTGPQHVPGKESGKEKEQVSPGIGGQVLRERQLRAGEPKPRDPKEVSEAMRRRYQQQQGQAPGTDPRLGDKMQQRPLTPPLGAQPPVRDPALRERTLSQPTSPAGEMKAPLQKLPADKQQDEQSSGDPKPPSTIRQQSPFIQQQRLPAYSK